jgi:pyrimidine operon attenuation protein / uracil phosphoribosyltransferase
MPIPLYMHPRQTLVLSNLQIEQKINRLAYQIYEDCSEETELIIAGIAHNGYSFARKLAAKLESISPLSTRLVEVTVNDKLNPLQSGIQLSVGEEELRNKVVILADDVLNSGLTLFYSLTVFLNVPLKKLRTVVLVDRNHKRYPISADFVGLSLATTMQEHIRVVMDETTEAVYLS